MNGVLTLQHGALTNTLTLDLAGLLEYTYMKGITVANGLFLLAGGGMTNPPDSLCQQTFPPSKEQKLGKSAMRLS